jgi:hypothetical protein
MSTTRRNNQTGMRITVGNAAQDGWCTEGGPWYTICEDHHTIMNYPTKALATSWAASPRDWCEHCNRCAIHRAERFNEINTSDCISCQRSADPTIDPATWSTWEIHALGTTRTFTAPDAKHLWNYMMWVENGSNTSVMIGDGYKDVATATEIANRETEKMRSTGRAASAVIVNARCVA